MSAISSPSEVQKLTAENLLELRGIYRYADQHLRPTDQGLGDIAEDLAERGLSVDDLAPGELNELAIRFG